MNEAILVEILSHIPAFKGINSIISTNKYTFSKVIHFSVNGAEYYAKILLPRGELSRISNKERLLDEYHNLLKVDGYLCSDKRFGTPFPVFINEDHFLLVTRALVGLTLSTGMTSAAGRFSSPMNSTLEIAACQQAGEFLRKLHSHSVGPYTTDEIEELGEYALIRFHEVLNHDLLAAVKCLIETLVELAISGAERHKVMCHNDFSPGNLLYDGECLNVVDFADFGPNHYSQDYLYFVIMINRILGSRLKYSQAARVRFVKSFIKGYGVVPSHFFRDPFVCLVYLKMLSVFLKTLDVWGRFDRLADVKNIPSKLVVRYEVLTILGRLKNITRQPPERLDIEPYIYSV